MSILKKWAPAGATLGILAGCMRSTATVTVTEEKFEKVKVEPTLTLFSEVAFSNINLSSDLDIPYANS